MPFLFYPKTPKIFVFLKCTHKRFEMPILKLGRATKEENKIFMLIMNSLDLSKVYGFKSLMTSQHYLMGPWDESSKHNYLALFPYRLT